MKIFSSFQPIYKRLETLKDVGLGYLKLGQPATTLSGGEAQRVKLSTYLSKRATGKTLFILDEPTTGLSFEDCNSLIKILHRLVDSGNSVLLIEHHLDIIKNSDYIIDLGPGAGKEGGQIMASGTPEEVASIKDSFTGQFLKDESRVVPSLSSKYYKIKLPKKMKTKMKDTSKFSFPPRTGEENNYKPASQRGRFRSRKAKSIF